MENLNERFGQPNIWDYGLFVANKLLPIGGSNFGNCVWQCLGTWFMVYIFGDLCWDGGGLVSVGWEIRDNLLLFIFLIYLWVQIN